MRTTLSIAFLLVAASLTEASQASQVPSDLVLADGSRLHPLLRQLGVSDPACHGRSQSCADCYSVSQCAYIGNAYKLISTKTCPDSAPFCDNGACVKVSYADVCTDAPPVANDFACNGEGYFPAPFDCTKFYVCTNNTAYVYNCPSQHVYDHATAGCVRLDENPSSCFSFNCAQNAGQYILYGPNPSVYAYCLGTASALVSSCPPNSRMNPSNGNEPCKPYCARQGRIANGDNETGYYECYVQANGDLSEPVKQFCPPGMRFDAASSRCQ